MFNLRVVIGTWGKPPRDRSASAVHLDARRYSIRRSEREIYLAPNQWRIMAALIAARGALVSREAIVDLLWGHCEDGGPLGAHGAIRVHLSKARKRIASLGLLIVNQHGGGYAAECVGAVPASDLVARTSPPRRSDALQLAA